MSDLTDDAVRATGEGLSALCAVYPHWATLYARGATVARELLELRRVKELWTKEAPIYSAAVAQSEALRERVRELEEALSGERIGHCEGCGEWRLPDPEQGLANGHVGRDSDGEPTPCGPMTEWAVIVPSAALKEEA